MNKKNSYSNYQLHKKKFSLKLLIIFFLGIVISINAKAFNYSKVEDVSKISLEEKIGQMLMVGFMGYDIDNNDVKTYIEKYHIGGVILFNKSANKDRIPNIKNRDQLKKLNKDLQKISKIPLFIAIDNEGGKIARLRKENGFVEIPSHEELGKLGEKSTYKYSRKLARELKSLGFNVNFAPIVDVNINPSNPIIGKLERSFSNDPKVVAKMAAAYIKGQNKSGIITSLKHFPGHGSSTADSHLGVVDVTKTWTEKELEPYTYVINNQKYNQMVMAAHVIDSKLDKNSIPASLSKNIMTDLLKNKLGFKGVIVTDSLDMQAISDQYTDKEVLIKAINGGADIILNANNNKKPFDTKLVENYVNIIKTAVKNNEISIKQIDNAYVKIIKLKKQFKVK